MFEIITKKEFINLLKTKENELLYTNLSLLETGCTKIMQLLHDNDFSVQNSRKCKAVKSNCLIFDNDSRLYFNSIKKCYQYKNVIISYDEYWDSFDECYRYAIIAYIIK